MSHIARNLLEMNAKCMHLCTGQQGSLELFGKVGTYCLYVPALMWMKCILRAATSLIYSVAVWTSLQNEQAFSLEVQHQLGETLLCSCDMFTKGLERTLKHWVRAVIA